MHKAELNDISIFNATRVVFISNFTAIPMLFPVNTIGLLTAACLQPEVYVTRLVKRYLFTHKILHTGFLKVERLIVSKNSRSFNNASENAHMGH